jgi:hypothetical protein
MASTGVKTLRFPLCMNPLLRTLPLLLGLALGTGCLSRPALVRETFLLPACPRPESRPPPPPTRSNCVNWTRPSRSRANRLLYRTGNFSYEMDPYAEFMVPPARMLRRPLSTHFRGAGMDLVDPGSPRRPTRQLEIVLTELYGDFRAGPSPAAVVTVHVTLSETAPTAVARVLLDKTYTQTRPGRDTDRRCAGGRLEHGPHASPRRTRRRGGCGGEGAITEVSSPQQRFGHRWDAFALCRKTLSEALSKGGFQNRFSTARIRLKGSLPAPFSRRHLMLSLSL